MGKLEAILGDEWFANTEPGLGNIYRKEDGHKEIFTITEDSFTAEFLARAPKMYRMLMKLQEYMERTIENDHYVVPLGAEELLKEIEEFRRELKSHEE